MLNRREFLATAAISSLGLPNVLANVRPVLNSSACTWHDDLRPKTIAIVGDLQRTSDAESIFAGRPQNDVQRVAVLTAIADDKPDMILMLGDQVSTGDDDNDWSYFDGLMTRINSAKIPVRSIMGNHDYGHDKRHCVRLFLERFPYENELANGVVRLGDIALVSVNTNFVDMGHAAVAKQAEQYRSWLKELEEDPTVRGVIVAAHHPPYTNSALGANSGVISMFATPFYQASKTRMFLSGHVHNYERFITGDKQFVVSGGGGGPLRPVDISESRPFQNDAYRSRYEQRPFHYLRMSVGERELSVETRFYVGGRFKTGDTFSTGLYRFGR